MKIKNIQFPDNTIEVIYSPQLHHFKKHLKKNKYDEETYKQYRYKYIQKRVLYIKKFIKQNPEFFKTFITLTFEDQEKAKNFKYCLSEFRKFYKRVKFFYKNFSYLMVPEYTQNNVIHFHILTNLDLEKYSKNDPRINVNNNNFVEKYHAFGDFWNLGFVDVKHINNNEFVILYLLKYIFKNNISKRVYYSSYDIKLKILKLKVAHYLHILSIFDKILKYVEKESYIFIHGYPSTFYNWVLWINGFHS
jgi:hypothetical protein